MDVINRIMITPFQGFCWITALPVEEEHYSYLRALIWPIPGFYFISWVIIHEWWSIWYLYVTLPVIALTYIIFLVFLRRDQAPKWFMVFTCQGVIAGLMYTYVLIGILIDLLNCFG